MSENTNNMFWIITGAVIVLGIFLLLNGSMNNAVNGIFDYFNGLFSNAG